MRIAVCAHSVIAGLKIKNGGAKGAKALIAGAAMVCLALLPLSAHAAGKSDLDHQNKKWWAWAEIGGFHDSEYDSELEVEVFLPIAQSAYSLLFLDIEGELFGNDMQDGAIALGYRQMFAEGWNLGVWAGPEVRRTESGNRFWRFDAGLELLHPDYDLRFNAYTPFMHSQSAGGGFTRTDILDPELILDDDEIYILYQSKTTTRENGLEIGLWGFDGEVGVRVPLEMAGIDPNNAELRLYGGGFYFDAAEAVEAIAGPKARAELRFYDVIPNLIGSRLTAEYEYSYDNVRGDRHQAGARFRIPFGSPPRSWAAASGSSKKAFAMVPVQPLTRQERRMLDGLEREDIFTSIRPGEETMVTRQLREQVGDYLTGVIFDRVAYVDPGEDLSDVSDASGNNTLIIVNGTIVTSETEGIQGFQTIQGGGSTIPIFGVDTGTVLDFTAPGAPAFIDSSTNGDVLALQGNHIHIAGLDIDGNGTSRHGINVGSNKNADPILPGTWNIVVDQTDVHDTGSLGDGVRLVDNNANVLIFNGTTLRRTPFAGVTMVNGNTNVAIMGVEIEDSGNGIEVRNNNSATTISDVVITDMIFDGIQVQGGNGGNQVDISNVQITDIEFSGIGIWHNNTVTISEADISNIGRSQLNAGIAMLGSEGGNTVTITDTTISDSGQHGIFAEYDNDLTIANVTMSDINWVGINIGVISSDLHGANRVTISNSTIVGAGIDGLLVTGVDPNTVTMTGTTFTGDFGDDVIDIDNAGNTLSGGGNIFDVGGTFVSRFCEVSGAQAGSGFDFSAGPVGGNAGPGVGGGPAFNCPGDVP